MKKIFALLALIVLVSGCVGTGGTEARQVKTAPNEGVQVNKFNIDPLFANEDDVIKIDVEVENVGGATAINANATLVGLDGSWRKTDGTVAASADVTLFSAATLVPPRPSENIAGDFKTVTKLLKPPDLPEGVQTDFPVVLRVDYTYRTSGSIVLPTISRSLYVEKSRAGQAIDSAVQVNSNNAPLKVALSTGRTPVILEETGTPEENFVIEILNVGSGMPITGNVGRIGATINALGPSLSSLQCGSATAVTAAPFKQTISAGDETKLRTSGKVEIPCTVKWSAATAGTTGSLTFTADVTYSYFLTQSKTVKLEGR